MTLTCETVIRIILHECIFSIHSRINEDLIDFAKTSFAVYSEIVHLIL